MSRYYIHYGDSKFDESKFITIHNRGFSNKPIGGLWASPSDADLSWKDWCEREDFKEYKEGDYFKFKLKDNARILEIKNKKDVDNLPKLDEGFDLSIINIASIDFEKLAKDYDAMIVWMYKDNSPAMFESMYYLMYGWDCDSILVFNKEMIEVISK